MTIIAIVSTPRHPEQSEGSIASILHFIQLDSSVVSLLRMTYHKMLSTPRHPEQSDALISLLSISETYEMEAPLG